jgi:hypothetical protein
VIERIFGSIEYEHFYRVEIENMLDLEPEVTRYQSRSNTIRPREGINVARPAERYRKTQKPNQPTPNLPQILDRDSSQGSARKSRGGRSRLPQRSR